MQRTTGHREKAFETHEIGNVVWAKPKCGQCEVPFRCECNVQRQEEHIKANADSQAQPQARAAQTSQAAAGALQRKKMHPGGCVLFHHAFAHVSKGNAYFCCTRKFPPGNLPSISQF